MMICKNRHLWEKMQIIGRFFYKFKSRAGTRPAPAISRGGLATASQDAIGDYCGIAVLCHYGHFVFKNMGKHLPQWGKKHNFAIYLPLNNEQ